jgi:hypothetical protein
MGKLKESLKENAKKNPPQQHSVDVEILVHGLNAASPLLTQVMHKFIEVKWLVRPHPVLSQAEIKK